MLRSMGEKHWYAQYLSNLALTFKEVNGLKVVESLCVRTVKFLGNMYVFRFILFRILTAFSLRFCFVLIFNNFEVIVFIFFVLNLDQQIISFT
jgi:hypothetical protein